MPDTRPPRIFPTARLAAVEIVFHWRWVPVVVLATALLAHGILPVKFPTWETPITWVVSLVAVVAGEIALLIHELSHAVVGRSRGHTVTRIVFHGFVAETIVGAVHRHDATVALVGPAVNLAIAGLVASLRVALSSQGPLDVLLLLLVLGNLALAVMSLQPFGQSDGARALRAWRNARAPKVRS